VAAESFGGPIFPQIKAAHPNHHTIDRTVINAWSDPRVANAVRATKRKKLLIAGLWTDNCVMLPALSALKEGYDVYIVADASGDPDAAAHELALQRLVQAGATPVTWIATMLEWQGDWARSDTSGSVLTIAREHGGAMGMAGFYREQVDRLHKGSARENKP
jgi:nicotinamidase-related amidase